MAHTTFPLTLTVLWIQGRYPHHPEPLRSEHVQVDLISRDGDQATIRLADQSNPEFWLEICFRLAHATHGSPSSP